MPEKVLTFSDLGRIAESDLAFGSSLSGMLKMSAKVSMKAVQLVHESGVCRKLTHGGSTQWIISADRWLNLLP